MFTLFHNYKVYIKIKVTTGGENYNYNYCTRKAVIITLLITTTLKIRSWLQHLFVIVGLQTTFSSGTSGVYCKFSNPGYTLEGWLPLKMS